MNGVKLLPESLKYVSPSLPPPPPLVSPFFFCAGFFLWGSDFAPIICRFFFSRDTDSIFHIVIQQYGAGLVESSLSTISRPLTKRVALNQLDDFACRQLDRLGGPTVSHSASSHEMDEMEEDARSHARREIHVGASKFVKDDDAAAAARGKEAAAVTTPTAEDQQMQQTVAVVSRSRWQTVLVEAGGLGAAVSDESLKSLRYCLQWLIVSRCSLSDMASSSS